jgi:hypothetical protein
VTWRDYSRVLEDIAGKWGRLGILPDASAQQYFNDLSDLPVELVMRAVQACYRNGEKYPPTGWRIRIAALEIDVIAPAPAIARRETPELEETWKAIRVVVDGQVPQHVRAVWLDELQPYALELPALYVEAPAKKADWIRRRFSTLLQAAAEKVNPELERVELVSIAAEVQTA